MKMKHIVALLMIVPLLSACGAAGRISNVGKAPRFTPQEEIETAAAERSIARPNIVDQIDPQSPSARPAPQATTASLFRSGAGGLFRDQRAAAVGDIVTIRINVQDRASVDNTTSRSRSGSENAGLAALLGLQKPLSKVLGSDTGDLVGMDSRSQSSGTGTTERSETINMTMAAVVTSVLPNGNLVIRGRQEMRVNFELRELIVTGIIRPQDIARDNSIRHTQIAEARISYGGRGQLTDVQQARWAQQIYDALFPF